LLGQTLRYRQRQMLASTTNLNQCYQLLGIYRGASIDELKAAYRLLARKFHPDLNPGDADSHQRFIAVNQAYQILLDKTQTQTHSPQNTATTATTTRVTHPNTPPTGTKVSNPTKSEEELKWQLYAELQLLLKQQQFLKAIVLIEGLAHHTPLDAQVCQWQGIIYSQYGHQLIQRREFHKAGIYLKKALKVDPHNRQLWQEVDRAFNRITQLS
jgi:tetratricopeptide (TPR) repeat protein